MKAARRESDTYNLLPRYLPGFLEKTFTNENWSKIIDNYDDYVAAPTVTHWATNTL
uniref:Uncharacterized protein n=1 Tax=Globisporangium ultimum (strain ATCC 200006 / CBS 805.95 / DAOM BR144) TaxID=431595 RepID=K3WBF6_GLOUD